MAAPSVTRLQKCVIMTLHKSNGTAHRGYTNDHFTVCGREATNVSCEFYTFQIDFLNSVIVDMQRKNEELKARLEAMESGDYINGTSDELGLELG